MTTVSEKLAEVIPLKFDLLDAVPEFSYLRFLRVVHEHIVCGGVVEVHLTDE